MASGPAAQEEDAGDAFGDFVETWGFDESSVQMLRSQPLALVEDVIANFAPDPNTRNVNAKLYAFVKAKQAGGTQALRPQPIPENALQQFAQTWSLDESAVLMLRKLPPDICAGVLADFNPPAETQNVNAKLSAFVRGRMEKVGLPVPSVSGGPVTTVVSPAAAPLLRQPRQPADPVRAFVARWGCDAQCESTLRQLQPEHQAMVMREFDPPPGTYNVSGKLSSFVRSVVSRDSAQHAPADPTQSFALHWGLDAEALQSLRSLPEDLQAKVMAEFSPPAGTLNVSGKLSAFIRAKLLAGAEAGAAKPYAAANSAHAAHSSRSGLGSRGSEGALQEFATRWRLDNEAVQLLQRLPEDVRSGVIQDFQPRSDTWNFSGKLHAFVRARLKELDLEGLGAGPPASAPWGAELGAAAAPDEASGDDVADFVARWGLDRSSEELLRQLPAEMQEHVLSSFEPQANTRNRNAKLVTWVRSLQAAAAGEAKRPRLA